MPAVRIERAICRDCNRYLRTYWAGGKQAIFQQAERNND